jgi:adenosylcobinamide-phosphate synthase
MMPSGLLLGALALDAAFGDPDRAWHPVRRLGALITWGEGVARRDQRHLKLRGVGLALFVVGSAYLSGLVLVHAAALADQRWALQGWLSLGVQSLLVWLTLAVRGMLEHTAPVLAALKAGDLARARVAVGRIVGRDTSQLDERGVCRACLESVAEGLADGVIAPLFFAALGGAPLALAYRAVNTLDSMVGYKDERYLKLGWASARLDDVANWLPARKAALFTMVAALPLGLRAGAAWRMARRDAPKQPSPNSGWPEGAFAGALGVQLGGPIKYRGRVSEKATLGEPLLPLDLGALQRARRLFVMASVAAVLFYEVLAWFHV